MVMGDAIEKLKAEIALDGGLAVYEYFGFQIGGPKRQKSNPFRTETTVSFDIFRGKDKKIRYKDHGDDTYCGDCWRFVEQITGASKADSFRILLDIYGIEQAREKAVAMPPRAPKPAAPAEMPDRKIGHIAFRPFSEEEAAFFEAKTGAPMSIVETVFQAVSSFSYEGMKANENMKFMFAATIIPGQCYKLYAPKAEHRPAWMPAKTLFFPGLAPAKEKNPEYFYSIGRIPRNAPFLLVGGESDYIAATAMGIAAYTLGAEVSRIPEAMQEEIVWEEAEMFVCFDTDFTGEYHSRLLQNHGARRIELPLEHQLWRFEEKSGLWKYAIDGQLYPQPGTDGLHTKPEKNDICDAIALGIDLRSIFATLKP